MNGTKTLNGPWQKLHVGKSGLFQKKKQGNNPLFTKGKQSVTMRHHNVVENPADPQKKS
jgi:hypothetical protein